MIVSDVVQNALKMRKEEDFGSDEDLTFRIGVKVSEESLYELGLKKEASLIEAIKT
jgi:hypothetical protein